MPIVIQQGQGGLNGNGSHRPFAVALLLVLLFLSTRSDWNTAARRQRMEVRTGMGRNSPQTQSAMRDKVRKHVCSGSSPGWGALVCVYSHNSRWPSNRTKTHTKSSQNLCSRASISMATNMRRSCRLFLRVAYLRDSRIADVEKTLL